MKLLWAACFLLIRNVQELFVVMNAWCWIWLTDTGIVKLICCINWFENKTYLYITDIYLIQRMHWFFLFSFMQVDTIKCISPISRFDLKQNWIIISFDKLYSSIFLSPSLLYACMHIHHIHFIYSGFSNRHEYSNMFLSLMTNKSYMQSYLYHL